LPANYKLGKNASLFSIQEASICLGDHFFMGDFSKMITEDKSARISVGEMFRIKDHCTIRGLGGCLKIGDHVFLNSYTSINCLFNIEIGDKVLIGENVKIYDHNHKYEINAGELNVASDEYTVAKVHIGNHCWIGSNVTILKGVSIGENSIIGAGCVIYKSIPANSIVVNKQNLDIQIKSV
jgi:acetyltransferase-like isoleucine patch superfamily enzyme